MNYRGTNSLNSFRLGNSILINNILDTIANYASSGSLGVQGSQGFQGTGGSGGGGFQGPQGPQGLTGANGERGPQGLIGLTGLQGTEGSTGPYGGPIGPQGLIGVQGSTGNIGTQGFMGATGPIAGSDTQILFNQSGNVSGDDRLTYNYTNNVLISLGDLSLSSRVPHKFYTYTGTTTTSGSRAELTLTFTSSSFISKVTAILKNSSSVGTSVILLTDIHDASDNIYISSQNESHTSSLTNYIWDMVQNTSTNTTLTFKTTSETTTFDYQVLVEIIGDGSLSSISDGTVTQSYTF